MRQEIRLFLDKAIHRGRNDQPQGHKMHFEYVVSAIHTPLDDGISACPKVFFHLISLNVDRTAIKG